LWSSLAGARGGADRVDAVDDVWARSIVVSRWPVADGAYVDDAAEAELAALQRVVTEVRRFRADQGLKPGQRVAAELGGLNGLTAHETLIRSLVRLDDAGDGFAATATLAISGGVTVRLDTRGSIDVAAERARLVKDRATAEKEAAQCRAKLDNPAFIGKAPDPVVAKIRDRLAAAEGELARIGGQLDALPAG
jgi:valyl-tRNA synthetase